MRTRTSDFDDSSTVTNPTPKKRRTSRHSGGSGDSKSPSKNIAAKNGGSENIPKNNASPPSSESDPSRNQLVLLENPAAMVAGNGRGGNFELQCSNSSDCLDEMWKNYQKKQLDERMYELDGDDEVIKKTKVLLEALEARRTARKEATRNANNILKAACDELNNLKKEYFDEKAAKHAAVLHAEALGQRVESMNQERTREQNSAAEKFKEVEYLKLELASSEKMRKAAELELLRARESMARHSVEVSRLHKDIEAEVQMKEHWEEIFQAGESYKKFCEKLFAEHIQLKKQLGCKVKDLEQVVTGLKDRNWLLVDFVKGNARNIQDLYVWHRNWVLLEAEKMSNLKPVDGKWDVVKFCEVLDLHESDSGVQCLLAEMFVRGDLVFTKDVNPNWLFGDVEFRAEMWYRLENGDKSADSFLQVDRPVRCGGQGTEFMEAASFWIARKNKALSGLKQVFEHENSSNRNCEDYVKQRIEKALKDGEPAAFDKNYVDGMKQHRLQKVSS